MVSSRIQGNFRLLKFSVQPVEMEMEHADLLKIFRNKLTASRGIPSFSFQPVGREINVPFAMK